MRRFQRRTRLLAAATLSLALGGCGILGSDTCVFECGRSQRASTPLVDFLYGNGRRVPRRDEAVTLNLPIRVGLAFLPSRSGNPNEGPTPVQRERILSSIRANFAGLPYVSEIVPVPAYYFDMTNGNGMQQLEQLARLQRLDLMALISYDQRSSTTENRRAITYLTIVGGMIFEGTHNQTQTIIDLAVVEPVGRSLVLRAGGVSSGSDSTSAIDQSHKLAKQQRVGFDQATDKLIANFRTELSDFETRVRAGTADVKVVRQGRGGGGAFDPVTLTLLLGLLATLIVVRRARESSGRRPSASARW